MQTAKNTRKNPLWPGLFRGRTPFAPDATGAHPERPLRFSPLLALLLYALFIAGSSYAVHRVAKSWATENASASLEAVARLKTGEIERWIEERSHDVQTTLGAPLFADTLRQWLRAGGRDEVLRQRLLGHLRAVAKVYHNSEAGLYSMGDGALLLSAMDQPEAPHHRGLAAQAAREDGIVLEDFHLEEGGRIALGFFIPVRQAGSTPLAVAHFEFDPSVQLYPLIRTWPSPSASAETLLVRREGDQVVFLNTLRHVDAPPLGLRLPMASPRMPSAIALAGHAGFVSGEDYRGVPVLAYVMPVAGTPWAIVSKMDQAEAYAHADTLAALTGTAIAVILLIVWWWWSERAVYAAALFRDRIEHAMLARRVDGLLKHAGDCMILYDPAGRIVEVNDRTLATYGYSREEMLRMTGADLRAPALRGEVPALIERLARAGAMAYETVHCRKDGSLFPVDATIWRIEREGGSWFQAIIRDIGERRATEAALRASEARLNEAQRIAALGSWELDLTRNHLAWSAEIYRIFEIDPAKFGASYEAFLNTVHPDDRAMVDRAYAESVKDRTSYDIEHRLLFPDGRVKWVRERCETHYDAEGLPLRSVGTVQDITDHKGLEEERIRQAQKIKDLSHSLVAVQEEERRQLALELHDVASPNLAAVRLNLDLICAALPKPAPAESEARLADTRALLQDTTQSLRNLCANLRPAALDYAGLASALDDYVREFARRTGIDARMICADDEKRLPPEVEALLFRITQEALTNAAKHARARTIGVELIHDERGTTLAIVDDGAGFDAARLSEPGHRPGLGLLTMSERAEFAGGSFELKSRPGEGTRITVVIPRTDVPADSACYSVPTDPAAKP